MVRNMKAKPGNDLLTNSQADQVTNAINVPGYLSQIIIVSWKNTDNLSWQQTEIIGKKKPALFEKVRRIDLDIWLHGRYTKGKCKQKYRTEAFT